MTVKLPESLPYDFVDEMIDEQVFFRCDFWKRVDEDTNEIITKYRIACRRFPDDIDEEDEEPNISNWGRELFEILCDSEKYAGYEEDEDGYTNYPYSNGMVWTAKELSEQEIEGRLGYLG